MITENKVFHSVQGTSEIFCLADDFCKYSSTELKKYQLSDGKVHRKKTGRLSDAEVITILHSKGFRCLKHFYTQYVCKHMRHLFPKYGVIQQVRGIADEDSAPSNGLYQGGIARILHRDRLC